MKNYTVIKDTGAWCVAMNGRTVREFLSREMAELFCSAWNAGTNPTRDEIAEIINRSFAPC
jgi:hypothetical protein